MVPFLKTTEEIASGASRVFQIMKITVGLIILLFLLTSALFSQETSPAEKMRVSKGYRQVLAHFGETPIYPASNPHVETYRIFISPTFSHALSIRVEKKGNGYVLVAKYLSGEVGYDWGKLEGEKRRRITETEWRKLLYLLDQASFWTLSPQDKEPVPNENGELAICLDNTDWYLEGVRDNKYQVVDRYCPESQIFKAVGLYMVKLSGLKVKESDLH